MKYYLYNTQLKRFGWFRYNSVSDKHCFPQGWNLLSNRDYSAEAPYWFNLNESEKITALKLIDAEYLQREMTMYSLIYGKSWIIVNEDEMKVLNVII